MGEASSQLEDGADGFCAALAEDEFCAGPQVLWMPHKAEARRRLVARSNVVQLHADDPCRLPNAAAMHHGLHDANDSNGVRRVDTAIPCE